MATEFDPEAPRQWLSLEDDDEQRTWVFDVTFLRSSYRCIYGAGCKGVLDHDATELAQGCCSFGAHFVDEDDVANLVAHFVRLEPRHMQFHATATEAGFLDRDDDTDSAPTVTRVVDDACIFLNRPGFAGGTGCALHIAAEAAGERPLDWKPNVCWQVPIRLEHSTDEHGHVTSRVRDWKRRDWGAGGDEFHWWCTDTADAYVGDEPVYRSARDELTELVGSAVYERLVTALEQPQAVGLPEPVRRN